MNKLLIGWRPYAIAAVVICVLAAVVLALQSRDDRFGDPDVISQIKSSTDCDQLRDWADGILTADANDDESFDLAVGYANAANDRMDEIGC